MAYREVTRVDIQEIIRRWQAGEGYRRIAAGTSLSRNTVRKYLSAAKAEDITKDGSVPTDDQLSRLAVIGQSGPRQAETPSEDVLAPWADPIHRWLTGERLQLTRILELLLGRGCRVSCQSLRRFVRKRNCRRPSKVTVRMEDTPPGEVVEVDFGRPGLIHDPDTGRRRAVWALLLVLGYSRHCFVWPTFGQTLEDVIAELESAWSFFGGVPKYLVIDNCPPAVATAGPLHPVFTRGFLEYSQRRGFIADAARVRHPKDKPKVERGVPYARERFASSGTWPMSGSRPRRWWPDVAGLRIHGTTRRKPLVVFQDEERHALLPWDGEAYEIADWRYAKVHAGHHIQCRQALYSVPSALCPPGQRVEIRVDSKLVHIYHRGRLIKTHVRQPKGGRATDPEDYPATSPRTPPGRPATSRHCGRVGVGGGHLRRAPLRRPPLLGQDQAGTQAAPPGGNATRPSVLTPPAAGPLDVDLIDVRRVERILMQALEEGSTPELPMPLATGRSPGPAQSSPILTNITARRHEETAMTRANDLTPLLKRLQLGPMAATLPERIALARREQLDYASFLEIILSDEVNRRAHRRIEMRLQGTGFQEICRLEDFDWSASITMDRRLTGGCWTPHSLWNSWPGTSTYCWWARRESARASWPRLWATPLSERGIPSASFMPTTTSRSWPKPGWTTPWSASSAPSCRLPPDLLILDDLGLHRFTAQQSADLYGLIRNRHRASRFVITSNRAVEEWLGLFEDPVLGNSALDRLANASCQIVIEGNSLQGTALPTPGPAGGRGGH